MVDIVGRKIKLKADLTRYHKSLVVGAEGYLIDPMSNRGDRFADIRFPQAGVMPILYDSMEIDPPTEAHIDSLLKDAAEEADEAGLTEKANEIRSLIVA